MANPPTDAELLSALLQSTQALTAAVAGSLGTQESSDEHVRLSLSTPFIQREEEVASSIDNTITSVQ